MTYSFRCTKCKTVQDVDIPINDYDTQKDKQLCPECKEKMERVIEWNGIATGNGGGWFGKSDGGKVI